MSDDNTTQPVVPLNEQPTSTTATAQPTSNIATPPPDISRWIEAFSDCD